MPSQSVDPSHNPQPAGLPASRARLLCVAWVGLTLFLLIRLVAQELATQRTLTPSLRPVRIDINRASPAELTALPGIGGKLARSIVLQRVRHGWFASLDELCAVDGIGTTRLRQLRGFLQPICQGSR